VPIDLVGRAPEIAELDRILDAVVATPSTPAGLVLEGPAGIGKSSLLAAARERARARGLVVLEARPSEAEATYAFQALADLLEPLQPEVAALPGPQRRSLEVALLREDPTRGEAVDMHAVAIAASNAVRSGARRQPLLIAVDDAPWLDQASATALEFIVRRLSDRPVGVVLAQRVDAAGPAPLDLDRALPTERVWLGPLGRAELHVLLASRLDLVLPRPILAKLDEASEGNPFHALEIGRALQRLPAMPKPGEPLPVPESVRALIGARLDALPPGIRHLLLVAALAGSPSLGLLGSALGADGGSPPGIDTAVDAGLVTIDGQIMRFAHPLIASTVVASAGESARREAHRALAAVVTEPEARGRHMALATTGPDPGVAQALEDAAIDAERRGASRVAVELFRLAVDLTPVSDDGDGNRRRARLGNTLVHEADLQAARQILDEVLDRLPPGQVRAEASLSRATISWYAETADDAVRHMEDALNALGYSPEDEPTIPDDPIIAELLGRIHLRLAHFHVNLPVSRRHCVAAAALLEHHGPRDSYATALLLLMWIDAQLGLGADESLLQRALALEEGGHEDSSTLPGHWWLAMDRPDLARERYRWMRRAGLEIGELSGEPDNVRQSAQVEIYADDWPRARALIDEASMLAAQDGERSIPDIRVRALLDAHEGRLDEAEAAVTPALARAFADGETILAVALLHVLTFVAASRPDATRVLELTEESRRQLDSVGYVDALRIDPLAERVEALVAAGRLEEAATGLAELDHRQEVLARPWLAAAIARGRALLLLAQGDEDAAVAATDPATDDRSKAWRVFDRARTLLVRGQVLRQLRRPREAGLALDAALAIFERLGARSWAARTQAELRRLGRRRSANDELTPAEGQVAALAASGLRNHEMADQLGVSPKTIEAHLARIYSKLGIRSRAELGRAMARSTFLDPQSR
jgi:DNA-binding CsgD family transcriptional regulator